MNSQRHNLPVKSIVQTGLFVAIAIVVRNFSYMVYIGGVPGMRISFTGVFTRITAILFGPFFGGAASGIIDITGYILKPEGAFIPFLTVTAIIGGSLTGILWKACKNVKVSRIQGIIFVFVVLLGVIGILNHIQTVYFPDSYWAQSIKRLGKNRDYASIGLEVAALLGLILISANLFLKKIRTKTEIQENFLKVLVAIGISGIVVTTLNTYILRIYIPELLKIPFLVFWIPRVIQEILMSVIQAYIISLLIGIYRRIK